MNEDEGAHVTWIETALERYEDPLVRYAAHITGDLDLARDVVQDTFLDLCRSTKGAVDDHLAAWLFRVCRNRAIDAQRRETRVQKQTPRASAFAASTETSGAADDEDEVLTAIGALPERQREVLLLKFLGELSYKEISALTGLSNSNVGVLIHTALKALREHLHVDVGSVRPA